MRIRLARDDELDAVGDLTVAAYAELAIGPDDSYLARLRDARSRAEQAELWVAEDDGVLFGTVTRCPPGSPWRELAGADEGEFRMLAVSPQARGRGVGEALARHMAGAFAEEGVRRMVLSSAPSMTAAHRLYERLGYVRAPERDWSPTPGVHLLAYVLIGVPAEA